MKKLPLKKLTRSAPTVPSWHEGGGLLLHALRSGEPGWHGVRIGLDIQDGGARDVVPKVIFVGSVRGAAETGFARPRPPPLQGHHAAPRTAPSLQTGARRLRRGRDGPFCRRCRDRVRGELPAYQCSFRRVREQRPARSLTQCQRGGRRFATGLTRPNLDNTLPLSPPSPALSHATHP